MNSPRTVSVLVPTYNRSYCIARTLDSALQQTHRDVEVIVIDDGSTDNTRALIAQRYAGDARVRYFYQQNRGVAAARNLGLRMADGEYIAFLDSDDIWKPWKLELQLQALDRVPEAGMVWTDMEAIDPDGMVFEKKYLRHMYDAYRWFTCDQLFERKYPREEWLTLKADEVSDADLYVGTIYSQMIMGNLVHTSTVLLRRERVEKVGLFREELAPNGEDYEYHLRACRAGPVAFVDVAGIQYQRGMPDRLTRPEYGVFLAENFFGTVEEALRRDRSRIRLPRRMKNAVRAEAAEWAGRMNFYRRNYRKARSFLLRSLYWEVLQPKVWAMVFAASFLPQVMIESLLSGWHSMTRGAEISHADDETRHGRARKG